MSQDMNPTNIDDNTPAEKMSMKRQDREGYTHTEEKSSFVDPAVNVYLNVPPESELLLFSSGVAIPRNTIKTINFKFGVSSTVALEDDTDPLSRLLITNKLETWMSVNVWDGKKDGEDTFSKEVEVRTTTVSIPPLIGEMEEDEHGVMTATINNEIRQYITKPKDSTNYEVRVNKLLSVRAENIKLQEVLDTASDISIATAASQSDTISAKDIEIAKNRIAKNIELDIQLTNLIIGGFVTSNVYTKFKSLQEFYNSEMFSALSDDVEGGANALKADIYNIIGNIDNFIITKI